MDGRQKLADMGIVVDDPAQSKVFTPEKAPPRPYLLRSCLNAVCLIFIGAGVLASLGIGVPKTTPTPRPMPSTWGDSPGDVAQPLTPTPPPDPYKIWGVKGVTDEACITIEGDFKNKSLKVMSMVEVTFPIYDAQRRRVGDARDLVTNLEPAQTWHFKAVGVEDDAKRFDSVPNVYYRY